LHQIKQVAGFLGKRFQANIMGRLKDVVLSEQYIRWHERKDYDDWFWVGEQLGKWLDAAAYSAVITQDQLLRERIDELITRLARSQEADGYLGVTVFFHRNPARGMELYEWYYLLHGLLTCAEVLNHALALQTAQRLGHLIMKTWGPGDGQFPLAGPYPGNGHTGGEGSIILEPMALLAQRTNDAAMLAWCEATVAQWDAWFERYPMSVHTCGYSVMKQLAAQQIEIYDLREHLHAHTFHMSLLGLAALYEATGNPEYRAVVLGCVDQIRRHWVFITGGMSTGERYVSPRFYHPTSEIEVCPQHTWLLLLAQAYQWTGEAAYLDEIERDVFNHLLAAQLADGSNWSYMTPMNGHSQEPEHPNCCNASGQRIVARLPTYLYGVRDHCPAVLLFADSEAEIAFQGGRVRLHQTTTYPEQGNILIEVHPETAAAFPLHIRIPAFAPNGSVRVNQDAAQPIQQAGFMVIDRTWQPGDTVQIDLALPITCQHNEDYIALMRGPLVYTYFEAAQPDHEQFQWHHNRRSYEIEWSASLSDLETIVHEDTPPPGCLGPALRITMRTCARAPLFASAPTNRVLPPAAERSAVLLPFVNQGAVRGDYQTFMRRAKG
jgi:hypothetical protein